MFEISGTALSVNGILQLDVLIKFDISITLKYRKQRLVKT